MGCLKGSKALVSLLAGEKGVGESGKPLSFKGSTFHRTISMFMIQVREQVLDTRRCLVSGPLDLRCNRVGGLCSTGP